MRSENRADKTLVLLLNDKPAAVPITAIPAVHRWGKWPLILARRQAAGSSMLDGVAVLHVCFVVFVCVLLFYFFDPRF